MFLNLSSVIYDVSDLQEAKKWYSKVLGTEPDVEEPSSVVFFIGNARLGLNHVEQAKPGIGFGAYWAVSDIHVEYQRLIELGATEFDGIRAIGRGVSLATLKDPFGNLIGIGSLGTPDNQTIEEKPSETALWTTLMRAFSTSEEHEEIRGRDQLAEIFLPKDMFDSLQNVENRQTIKEKYFVIGVCEYVMARTRMFDRFFKEALEGDVEQVVFLGAGYDSRPYRFREQLGSMQIFELDAPPTQRHKRQCLKRAGIEIPDQLIYAPINFNTESIKDVLDAAGFDKTKKTLFMWEGVTYYLSAEAVNATLAFIRSNSPAGSIVAFDYVAVWAGVFDAYGVKELMDFNASKQSGETGGFFLIPQGTVESFLAERGFAITVHQNSEDFEKNFLTLKDGSLFGRVTGHFRIVQAITKE
jgi:methyltransferase (TIGR00027 family)